MDSIAITDIWWLYWAIEFYEIAKKNNIKPIIGVEISIVNNILKKDLNEKFYNITLIAQNYEWYENLLKLVSIWNLDWFNNFARIDIDLLKKYSNWIIGFMWWIDSQIWQMIISKENQSKIIEYINMYKQIFWENNFLLEIIVQDYKKEKELKQINDKMIELSQQTNTKLIVNNNYHYINKEDKEAYEILLCIKDWKFINSPDIQKISWDYHIASEQEIIETLKNNWFEDLFISELIDNNYNIAKSIDLKIELGKILFPKYESSENIKKLYEEFQKN